MKVIIVLCILLCGQSSLARKYDYWGTYRSQDYVASSSPDKPSWRSGCQYPQQNCGIENQPGMGSSFSEGYTYIGPTYEKVAVLDSRTAGSSAARLITPYINAQYKDNICLSIEYLIQDYGVEEISLIQQDRVETRTIYKIMGAEKKGKWRMAKMDIITREGIVRYFVESRVKPGNPGALMIRNLEYKTGKCDDHPEYPTYFRRSGLMSKYFELQ